MVIEAAAGASGVRVVELEQEGRVVHRRREGSIVVEIEARFHQHPAHCKAIYQKVRGVKKQVNLRIESNAKRASDPAG